MKVYKDGRYEYWTSGEHTLVKDRADMVIRPLGKNISLGPMSEAEAPDDIKATFDNFNKLTTAAGLKGWHGVRLFDNNEWRRGKPGYTVARLTRGGADRDIERDDFRFEEEKIWFPASSSSHSDLIFNLKADNLYTDGFYIGSLISIDDDDIVELERGGKKTHLPLSQIRPVTGSIRSLDTGFSIDYVHGMRPTDIIGHRSIIFGDVVRTKVDDEYIHYIHLMLEPKRLQENQSISAPCCLVVDGVANYNIIRLSGSLGYNLETSMPCLFEGDNLNLERRRFKERYFNKPEEGWDRDNSSED